jgi:MFS family permease
LRNRWGVLAILFAVRLTMAFQFQSVAAVAPLLASKFGVNLADIGLLIGLYFTPGVALALPGGAIGKRFGDKTTVGFSLALMMLGSLVMAFADAWGWQMVGRLVAGAGGVMLNVQLTKMMTDWFAGQEIATAMAIFVNSWPAGVGISLLTLPSIGTAHGASAVFLAVAALIAAGNLLIMVYRPPKSSAAKSTRAARLDKSAILAATAAGLIWGLYNVGFAMVLSFGPSLFVERGWTIAGAGSVTSIVLWLSVVSVALGGFAADRLKRPQTILVAGSIVFAALMLLLAHTSIIIPIVIAIGLISGLPAGPIMSLPARVLQPATRAIGMGIFYTVYYAAMMLGPMIGGGAAKSTGSAAAAFDIGAVVLVACPLLVLLFNRIARAGRPTA